MQDQTPSPPPTRTAVRSGLMKYGMMACCAVMLLPLATFLIGGGTLAGAWSNAGIFAPLLICGAAHLVMHRMMGKPCHGTTAEQPAEARVEDQRTASLPARPQG